MLLCWLSRLTRTSVLFLGTHVTTGLTTCPHLTWLILRIFVTTFQNSCPVLDSGYEPAWIQQPVYFHASMCMPVGVEGVNCMVWAVLSITNAVGQCGNNELACDIGEAAHFATYFTGSLWCRSPIGRYFCTAEITSQKKGIFLIPLTKRFLFTVGTKLLEE